MSSPINAQVNGTFTAVQAPGAMAGVSLPQFVSLPPGYTDIKLTNLTDFAAATASHVIVAEGKSSLPGAALIYTGGGGGAITPTTSAAGFTFIPDTAFSFLTPPVAIAAITNANPAVITSATPAGVGDIVRIYDPLGMLQIGGWDFTNSTAAGATQTIVNLFAGAFGAPATGGTISTVIVNPRYYPQIRRITNIVSVGASSIVCMNVTHTYTVGQKVRIVIPKLYGMQEMNGSPTSGFGKGLIGTITAINAPVANGASFCTNTITLDIDSSGFSAFSFPTSAQGATGIGAPEVIPVGEAALVPYANLLDDATRNQSQTGVLINPSLLWATNNYSWVAYKGTSI